MESERSRVDLTYTAVILPSLHPYTGGRVGGSRRERKGADWVDLSGRGADVKANVHMWEGGRAHVPEQLHGITSVPGM